MKPSTPVQMSVYLMILGSIVAASNDLAFNLRGYVYVLLNDFFTAGNGVLMKKKLHELFMKNSFGIVIKVNVKHVDFLNVEFF